jgi:branched-chain amino acid transport system substrate-binding protein
VRADERAREADDTVWIGTMFPLKGPRAEEFGIVETEGVELGQRDFAEVLGAIGNARPLGLVTCDDSVDPDRAAHHLVADVHVPAVIGFGKNAEAVQLAESVFLPSHVLVMSSYNSGAMLTSVPAPSGDPRLVWRSMFSTTQEAGPVAGLVSSVLEPKVRAGGRPGAPIRVALLRSKNMSQLAVADALRGRLTFNGKSALLNGANFSEVVFDDASTAEATARSETATELLSFSPDIVVVASGDALASTVVLPLEEHWPAQVRRPFYAFMQTLPPSIIQFIGKHADRRRRFFGLTPVSTTPNNARLVSHFNETFHDKVDRTDPPNGSYDAFYVLGYASLGAPAGPVTGPALSRMLARLTPPGTPSDVGPLAIVAGYSALIHGENIDLDGTLGHLDFDPKTGEEPIDMAVLCVGAARDGSASGDVESGLVYDARTAKLMGEMNCP